MKAIGKPTGKYRLPSQQPEDKRGGEKLERDALYGPPPGKYTPEPTLIRQTERIKTGQASARVQPPEPPRPEPTQAQPAAAYDSAAVGGKLTICMLMFGEDHKLHRRLFNSVCRTVPAARAELRVACNQVSLDTLNMLGTYPLRKIYKDHKRRRKGGAMRDIFYDREDPIDTQWVVWFDDIAFAKDPAWLNALTEAIAAQKPNANVGLIGTKVRYELKNHRGKDPRDWFGRATWFTGKNFRNKLGKDAPNGDQIHLVHGNFFAISRRLIQATTLPDERISQSGTSICIGEQAHQLGFHTKQFNTDYRYVQVTHAQTKRGLSEKYPWE